MDSSNGKIKKMAAGDVELVLISKIKPAPWNPESREEPARLKPLIESISDIGLLYPVLIDKDNRLIDGHRRLAACKSLGHYHIRAIRTHLEYEHSYGSVQLNQEKLSGVDLLSVYIANPNALLNKQKDKIAVVEKDQGNDYLRYLAKNHYGVAIYYTARRVTNYTGGDLPIAIVTRWLIKYNLRGRIMMMLKDGSIKASTLKAAVAEDRPLKFQTVISVKELLAKRA